MDAFFDLKLSVVSTEICKIARHLGMTEAILKSTAEITVWSWQIL
jgi:hypothetical protein